MASYLSDYFKPSLPLVFRPPSPLLLLPHLSLVTLLSFFSFFYSFHHLEASAVEGKRWEVYTSYELRRSITFVLLFAHHTLHSEPIRLSHPAYQSSNHQLAIFCRRPQQRTALYKHSWNKTTPHLRPTTTSRTERYLEQETFSINSCFACNTCLEINSWNTLPVDTSAVDCTSQGRFVAASGTSSLPNPANKVASPSSI